MHASVRVVLASYPRWWKDRYGSETADLTEDLLADDDAHYLRVLVNLAVGSVLAWAHYRRPARPRMAMTPWGPVPDGGHRDAFGNRGLSPRSLQELEPGESVLGVMDAWKGSRLLATFPFSLVVLLVTWPLFTLLHPHGFTDSGDWIAPAMWSGLLAGCLVAKFLTSSTAVVIAVTSNGLAVFRMRGFTWRTDRLMMRLPAAAPRLVRTRGGLAEVDLAGARFRVRTKSFPLLRWVVGHAVDGTAPA
jgi:hypothetical protein